MKFLTPITTLFTTTVSVLGLSASVVMGNPGTDNYGNWISPNYEYYWRVVDSDPNGLNCRMRGTIEDILTIENRGYSLNFSSYWVRTTLPQGYEFRAGHMTREGALMFDDRGLPWLYNSDDDCFVRANSSFVRPVPDHPRLYR